MQEKHISNPKVLGRTIREARKAQGLTQETLANISGVARSFIYDVENGKETMNLGKVLLVCAALGVALFVATKWKE